MATQFQTQANRLARFTDETSGHSGRALSPDGEPGLPSDAGTRQLANVLGLFSFALGLVQVARPRELSRLIGIRPTLKNTMVMRAFGFREIFSGAGLFLNYRPKEAAKARVAGDIIDLALLGRALSSSRNRHARVLLAVVAVLGVTALDLAASRQLDQETAED